MKNYFEIHPAIRDRFIEIRGPLCVLKYPIEYTKGAIKKFDALLARGPVCLLNRGGQLFSIELPKNIDLSKIPNSVWRRL